MKFLFWLLAIPLFVFVVVFSARNTEPTVLHFWPIADVEAPLYAAVLVALLIGFTMGALVAWTGGGSVRRRSRQLMRDLEAERRETVALREKTAKFEAAEREATIPPQPVAAV